MVVLTRADLSKFLHALARRLPCPVKLIVTGGAEALLLGGRRPTGDIDFGLIVPARQSRLIPEIEADGFAEAGELVLDRRKREGKG